MNVQEALEMLQKAVQVLFSDRPVKVIVARDDSIEVVCVKEDVHVWDSSEKKESITRLVKGRTYHFSPAGWPVTSNGRTMMPIYWKRVIGWVNVDCFRK